MKVGDLVNFHTDAWVFIASHKHYSNPGIILSVVYSGSGNYRSDVWWSDGKITREHHSFLRSELGVIDGSR